MTKSLQLIINFAFITLKFDEIFGEVDPLNCKSIKLMKKFGFELCNEKNSDNTIMYRLTKENKLI
jgi:RimJ/RimL family protein N-acetyltransferase